MNYVASIAYGVVALLLLFMYAYSADNHTAMLLVVFSAALAWASCYMGAAYDMSDGTDRFTFVSSVTLTLIAVVVYLAAFAVILARMV